MMTYQIRTVECTASAAQATVVFHLELGEGGSGVGGGGVGLFWPHRVLSLWCMMLWRKTLKTIFVSVGVIPRFVFATLRHRKNHSHLAYGSCTPDLPQGLRASFTENVF